ncbi:MAG: c-type cytochrome [Candidatus Aquicultor sp.]
MKTFLALLVGTFISLVILGVTDQNTVSIKIANKQSADSLKNDRGKDSIDIGIGPVKTVQLGKIDSAMVQDGQSIFSSECSDCHDPYKNQDSGPSVKTFIHMRSPVFIMNYLLNTDEMNEKNSSIKESINKYGNTPMSSTPLTEQQARSLLEYFRSIGESSK